MVVVRVQANQPQNLSELSRDTENANNSISPIFNKEKEQKRLQTAQMIGEIGVQVGDIARTHGVIIATRKANEGMASLSTSDRAKAKSDWEKANPGKTAGNDEIARQAWQNMYDAELSATKLGTGSAMQQGIQAVTAAVQGLAGNNIGQAVSGASAPYLAEQIHKYILGNPEAQAMAHAVVGAITSYASGHDALAGAAGAVSGELMAKLVMGQLYPGKTVDTLSETEKQTVSALSTLASGLVGATVGGDIAEAVNAAQLGKNAVENNSLGDIAQAQSEGKTLEQKAGEYVEAENERYKKANCGGMSAEDCSVKMYTERREALKKTGLLGADFVPIVSDIKSFAEALSALDYLAAVIGIIPGAGDVAGKVIKAAETALKKGDLAEASRLINEGSEYISSKAKDIQIWSETKKKDPVSNAYGHWDKHKSEFPEYQNSKQYVEAAHSFVSNPPPGTLTKVRSNGERVYYNPSTNTFAVKRVDGVSRTMFKADPSDHGYKTNLDYFNAQ
ncbi:VENN motif pre-toxin domain-containing protein [Pantoea sp.]|uniref:VENN motif pre-toxin domain-containing protein n=1 Tax=Pantoea sp. TaxID=69393 RepID=UPI0031E26E87